MTGRSTYLFIQWIPAVFRGSCQTGGSFQPGSCRWRRASRAKEISRKGDEKRQINRGRMCPAEAESIGEASLSWVPALLGEMDFRVHHPLGTLLFWSVTKVQVSLLLSFHRLPGKNQQNWNFAVMGQKGSSLISNVTNLFSVSMQQKLPFC